MADGFFKRMFGKTSEGDAVGPLYQAIVAKARTPDWYENGGVADTIDGRFDMISAIFASVMIRLEAIDGDARPVVTLLTETFVTDMDGQLRELGFGDVGLGKRVGQMVSALGGRLGAYRDAFAGRGDLDDALVRNLYRGETPSDAALRFSSDKLRHIHSQISTLSLADLLGGRL